MTLKEIETLWQSRKTAMDVWHDRLHQMDNDMLIAMLLEHMPMVKAELILKSIDYDIHMSREEDTNGTIETTQ
jgi:hypothetical protein